VKKLPWSNPNSNVTTLTTTSNVTQSSAIQAATDLIAKQDIRITALEASISDIKKSALTHDSMLSLLEQWDQSKAAKEAERKQQLKNDKEKSSSNGNGRKTSTPKKDTA